MAGPRALKSYRVEDRSGAHVEIVARSMNEVAAAISRRPVFATGVQAPVVRISRMSEDGQTEYFTREPTGYVRTSRRGARWDV